MLEQKVSIVVPTTGERQELLRRAILSAFVDDESIFTEIIVIANGPTVDSFCLPHGILAPRNSSIQVVRTHVGSVSHARNIGLEAATGQWLRFLDDDDFLLPDTAKRQYFEAIELSCDISTYAGAIQDENGHTFQIVCPDRSQGYACAVLGPNCPALTFASIYRLEKIRHLRWNEEWSAAEDEDWMRRILQFFAPKWIVSTDVTGVWYQHSKNRLSKPLAFNVQYVNRATSIMRTTEILAKRNRLDSTQKKAAANGLWSAVHGGFYFSPLYWSNVAVLTRRMDNSSRPKDRIFSVFSWIHPVVIEWIFLPKRLVNHAARVLRGRLSGFNVVRKVP